MILTTLLGPTRMRPTQAFFSTIPLLGVGAARGLVGVSKSDLTNKPGVRAKASAALAPRACCAPCRGTGRGDEHPVPCDTADIC